MANTTKARHGAAVLSLSRGFHQITVMSASIVALMLIVASDGIELSRNASAEGQ